MEKNTTQQEILLIKGATFFRHQWCEKIEPDNNKHLSAAEKLEEACWNGMLPELLPGLIEKSAEGKSLLLWQMRQGKSFLEIELCQIPASIDYYYSIDPYTFLQAGFDN
ncbi:hypothetical protein BH10BAC2_BH10BAC2_22940 [soil metagenome]